MNMSKSFSLLEHLSTLGKGLSVCLCVCLCVCVCVWVCVCVCVCVCVRVSVRERVRERERERERERCKREKEGKKGLCDKFVELHHRDNKGGNPAFEIGARRWTSSSNLLTCHQHLSKKFLLCSKINKSSSYDVINSF